ncbi:hypothetical protein ACWENQ_11285 [Nonomuraea sp. NPDC004354]
MPGREAPGQAGEGATQGQDGPAGRAGGGRMPAGGGGPGWEAGDELTAYLEAHQDGATWLVAVDSAGQASSLILRTGKPATSGAA